MPLWYNLRGSFHLLAMPEIFSGDPAMSASRSSPPTQPLVVDKAAMLVEDDPDLLGVTSQILEHFGFQTYGFADGGKALQWFNAHHREVHLAMLDRRLPSIGGGALFRVMHVVAPDLPIILYSGDISGDEERQLLAEGVRVVLRKPIAIRQFHAAICEVMGVSAGDAGP